MITQSYKIDMTSGTVPIRIKVSQYDAGIRQLVFTLYNRGQLLTSSNISDLTAYVQGTKPDKKGFEYSCATEYYPIGCNVTVQITEQMTAVAGDVECELVLLDDGVRIGSSNFILEVERAALGEQTDISETVLPDIIDAGRQYAAAAEEAAADAAASAAEAEQAAGVAHALVGAGKMVSYTSGVIDTNIYLHREPKAGDRLFINITQDISLDDHPEVKVYEEYQGTAHTLGFGMVPFGETLSGLCLLEVTVDLLENMVLMPIYSFEGGTDYSAGVGIGIVGSVISNTKPNYGVSIDGATITSVTSGNLGSYVGESKYLVMSFAADAVPYEGGYNLILSYTGAVAIMKSAALFDVLTGEKYAKGIHAGTTIIGEVTTTGEGTFADPVHVNVIGEIACDLVDRVDAIEDAVSTEKTVGPADVIVVQDALALPAKSLITEIEPIQDLHGYDKPWAGGSEKNKAINFGNSGTSNSRIYTENADGSVTVTGTSTAGTQSLRSSQFFKLKAGTYTVSGCNQGATANDGDILVRLRTGSTIIARSYTNSPDATFTLTEETELYYDLRGASTTATSAVYTFRPQIEEGSSATSYMPYKNECPISGRTETTINDHGLNMLPPKIGIVAGDPSVTIVENNDGSYTISTSSTVASTIVSDATISLPVGSYALSAFNNAKNAQIYIMDSSNAVVGNLSLDSANASVAFTSSKTITKFRLRLLSGFSGSLTIKPMIVTGSTAATAYVPFTGNVDFTIQLGTTVYGADINWDTGVATITYGIIGASDFTAGEISPGGLRQFNSASAVAETTLNGVICSHLPVVAGSPAWQSTTPCATIGSGYVRIYVDTDGTTLPSEYSDIQVCYKLATPTTLQLTATQLQMLKGYNRVTIDNGAITLTYKANALDGKADDSDITDNVETSDTASQAYAVNDFMLRTDGIYIVTSAISQGDTIVTEGTGQNVSKTNILAQITALLNR